MGGRFTGGLAVHRASGGATGWGRSSTGGIRTHTHQGLSLAALPVGVPCHITNAEFGARNSESRPSIPCLAYCLQFRIPSSTIRNRKSAQRESNPHVRHGKAIGYRYIMGALISHSSSTRASRRESHPRRHRGKAGCYWLHHRRTFTSGSGGNRTHVHLLKRQAPSQRRTHFRLTRPHGQRSTRGSNPHPSARQADALPTELLDHIQQVAEESNPTGRSHRFWRPSAFPDAITTCNFQYPVRESNPTWAA